jgi:hypothetical protein
MCYSCCCGGARSFGGGASGIWRTSRAQIDIVIHNALGRPVRGARVDTQGGDGRVVATAASDDDGRISAKQIAVGT